MASMCRASTWASSYSPGLGSVPVLLALASWGAVVRHPIRSNLGRRSSQHHGACQAPCTNTTVGRRRSGLVVWFIAVSLRWDDHTRLTEGSPYAPRVGA